MKEYNKMDEKKEYVWQKNNGILILMSIVPSYKHYGFKPTDIEQRKDGFFFTPMEYTEG